MSLNIDIRTQKNHFTKEFFIDVCTIDYDNIDMQENNIIHGKFAHFGGDLVFDKIYFCAKQKWHIG